jgi:hypothetical protein
MKWRYFGRTGGVGKVVDIFRLPAALYDGKLDFEHFRAMERLLPDGSWVGGQGERAEKNWMDGWFDEEDEIDAVTVKNLMQKWEAEGWPNK